LNSLRGHVASTIEST